MKDHDKTKPTKSHQNQQWLFLIPIILVGGYLFFILWLTQPISVLSIDKAGVLGDSFGMLNALFTGLAFAGLYLTLKLQQEDLKMMSKESADTREEMKQARIDAHQQAVERTFFNMLETYQEIVRNLEYIHPMPERHVHGPSTAGKACFYFYSVAFREFFLQHYVAYLATLSDHREPQDLTDLYSVAYDTFYNDHQERLGHYFRYLYNIYRYIETEAGDKKELYSRLIRAQLSNYELALLFYNGLSSFGAKFKPLMEKYKLLDNLPLDLLIYSEHHDLYHDAWGDNPSIQYVRKESANA